MPPRRHDASLRPTLTPLALAIASFVGAASADEAPEFGPAQLLHCNEGRCRCRPASGRDQTLNRLFLWSLASLTLLQREFGKTKFASFTWLSTG